MLSVIRLPYAGIVTGGEQGDGVDVGRVDACDRGPQELVTYHLTPGSPLAVPVMPTSAMQQSKCSGVRRGRTNFNAANDIWASLCVRSWTRRTC